MLATMSNFYYIFRSSVHPCLFLRKSNQKYGTYISNNQNLSGATRHSSVLITIYTIKRKEIICNLTNKQINKATKSKTSLAVAGEMNM